MTKERNDWLPCGAPPALREGVVHVWYVELDVDDDVHARLADVTSEAERARARRLRIASAARRFLSARGALRTLLGAYLGCPPSRVPLPPGGTEKPCLLEPEDPSLRFNLSHSENHALIAVTRGVEIGVDIECGARLHHVDRLSRRYFTDRERGLLGAMDESGRKHAVRELWTRKEAFVKARGVGVYRSDLRALDIGLASNDAWLEVPDPSTGSRWSVRSIRPPVHGCAAAVAVEGAGLPLECLRWIPDAGASQPRHA